MTTSWTVIALVVVMVVVAVIIIIIMLICCLIMFKKLGMCMLAIIVHATTWPYHAIQTVTSSKQKKITEPLVPEHHQSSIQEQCFKVNQAHAMTLHILCCNSIVKETAFETD